MSDDRRRQLERLAYLYSALLLTRRVPNILVELHLIVRLLTCNLRNGTMSSSTKSNAKIFSCKADCTFFGALVIVSIHPIVIGFGRRFVYKIIRTWCSIVWYFLFHVSLELYLKSHHSLITRKKITRAPIFTNETQVRSSIFKIRKLDWRNRLNVWLSYFESITVRVRLERTFCFIFFFFRYIISLRKRSTSNIHYRYASPMKEKNEGIGFALPFRPSTDSRLHFRTGHLMSLYQNREKTRDRFLEILRTYV